MKRAWTRAERLALGSLLITIAGILVAIFLPELRGILNLHSESASVPIRNPSRGDKPTHAFTGPPQRDSTEHIETRSMHVSAKKMWTDTGIRVNVGDHISIDATGLANASGVHTDGAFKWVGPNGWGYTPEFTNAENGQPMNWIYVLGKGSSLGCMTGKIGSHGAPFMVGSSYMFVAQERGNLFLGFNDHISDWQGNPIFGLDNDGVTWPDNGGGFLARIRKRDGIL